MATMPYRSPDGSETATYATPGRRLAAAAIDWGICLVVYLIVSIPAGMLQIGSTVAGAASGAVDAAAQAFVLLAPAAYLAGYLRSGHTLGMRALDLHARVVSTGERPGWPRAAGRSLLSVLFGAAVYLSYFGLAGPSTVAGWSPRERAVLAASYVVTLAMVTGSVWALADARAQTLWDKLFGLVRLDDLTSSSAETARYNLWLGQRTRV